MNETELCQSLMSAIAGTPCPVNCGTAAIHSAEMVLLWDDRPAAVWLTLDAVASEYGKVLTTASIERGPHGRLMTGAIVRPHDSDLDAVAAILRARYFNATGSAGTSGRPGQGATERSQQARIDAGHRAGARERSGSSRSARDS